MIVVNPYLNFNGNCEEAFNFYKSVFGGTFAMFQRFKEVPPEMGMAKSEGEKVMHVALPFGEKNVLMGSDVPTAMGKVTSGNNFHISVSADSEKQATTFFNKLSAGGKITMPLAKTFWGAYFGMCVDKFGTHWMVSYEYSAKQ